VLKYAISNVPVTNKLVYTVVYHKFVM